MRVSLRARAAFCRGGWVKLTMLCGVVVDFNVRLLCIVFKTSAVCRAGKSYSEVGSLRVLLGAIMVRGTWANYRNAIGVVVFCCNEWYLKQRKKGFPPKLKWYQDLSRLPTMAYF
jgi:hypothetical protein